MDEARRQATTTGSVEPGMVFMPCGSDEEAAGAKPLLYGVRPTEDLAMFSEEEPAARAAAPAAAADARQRNAQQQQRQHHSAPAGRQGGAVPTGAAGLGDGDPTSVPVPGPRCSDGASSSAPDPNRWSSAAQAQLLQPLLLFSVRDLHGEACSIVPGTAAPGPKVGVVHTIIPRSSALRPPPSPFPTPSDGPLLFPQQAPPASSRAPLCPRPSFPPLMGPHFLLCPLPSPFPSPSDGTPLPHPL